MNQSVSLRLAKESRVMHFTGIAMHTSTSNIHGRNAHRCPHGWIFLLNSLNDEMVFAAKV
jgi:hypothetical protein